MREKHRKHQLAGLKTGIILAFFLMAFSLVMAGCGASKPAEPAEATKPKETAKSTELDKPIETAKPAEPSEDEDGDPIDPIDQTCFVALEGDYDVQECKDEDNFVGWYWHLAFFENKDGPYFTIYDDEAGNPGVEGYIVALNEHFIMVEIDPDYYEDLPKENWADQEGYLYLEYELTDDGVILTNGGEETAIVGIREYE